MPWKQPPHSLNLAVLYSSLGKLTERSYALRSTNILQACCQAPSQAGGDLGCRAYRSLGSSMKVPMGRALSGWKT